MSDNTERKRRTYKDLKEIKRPAGKQKVKHIPQHLLDKEKGVDNAKYVEFGLKLSNMPSIDITNVEEVNARCDEYFEMNLECNLKPTLAGLATAVGMNRTMLSAIVHDTPTGGGGYKAKVPDEVRQCLAQKYNILENLWESYMLNGKINPASGIYIGKNQFGYKDTVEQVHIQVKPPELQYSADDIRSKYLTMVDTDYEEIETTIDKTKEDTH